MSDTITVAGLVATEPKHIVTSEGLSITSFRLASAQRRFDRTKEKWIDVDTNWYTVSSFRQLASNVAVSVVKGQRVVVTGRVRIREWQGIERSGTNVDIEADSIGHDLSWGTANFSRTISSSTMTSSNELDDSPAESPSQSPEWHAPGTHSESSGPVSVSSTTLDPVVPF